MTHNPSDICFFTSTCPTSHGCCPSSLAMRPGICSPVQRRSVTEHIVDRKATAHRLEGSVGDWAQVIAIDCNRLQSLIYLGSKIQDPRCHGGLGSEILNPSWIHGSKISNPRPPGNPWILDPRWIQDFRSKTHMASWILDLGSMNLTEISDCNRLRSLI